MNEPEMTPSGAITIPEFIDNYKVGRTAAYEEIKTGRLATYKVGRRRYISRRAASEWQQEREAEAATDQVAA